MKHIFRGNGRSITDRDGFTLMELLVVTGILVLISSVTLASYNEFSGSTLVTNLAHEVGISIRLAQSYGLNVRGYDDSGITFDTSYGVHFQKNVRDSYLLFADPDRSVGGFKYVSGNEVEEFSLAAGYTISNVCAVRAGGGSTKCFYGGGGTINYMDIVFDRPDPDAYFTSNVAEVYERVIITIQSPKGATKDVVVLPTGHIGIE